jgi:uncharacterized NAD(P)/FAD-binding protein YdhS
VILGAAPILSSLNSSPTATRAPIRSALASTTIVPSLTRAGALQSESFVVGPMSQAAFWESIAVPDVRLRSRRFLGGSRSKRT